MVALQLHLMVSIYVHITSCLPQRNFLKKRLRKRRSDVHTILKLWAAGGGAPVSARWRDTRSYLLRKLATYLPVDNLSEITPTVVRQAQSAALADGLSSTTINKMTHHALAAAFRDAGLQNDALAKTSRLRETAPQTGAWTIEERDALLTAADRVWPNEFSSWLRFLFFTGLRLEESLALRWDDVCLKRGTISVTRSRFRSTFSPGKTQRSQRVFVAAPQAIDALRALKETQPLTGLIFVTPAGNPLDLHNFRRRQWRKLLEIADVPRWPLRCTRHTFATTLLDGGVLASEVAYVLGDNPATVLSKYAKHTMRGNDLIARALSYPCAGGGGAADARVPGGN